MVGHLHILPPTLLLLLTSACMCGSLFVTPSRSTGTIVGDAIVATTSIGAGPVMPGLGYSLYHHHHHLHVVQACVREYDQVIWAEPVCSCSRHVCLSARGGNDGCHVLNPGRNPWPMCVCVCNYRARTGRGGGRRPGSNQPCGVHTGRRRGMNTAKQTYSGWIWPAVHWGICTAMIRLMCLMMNQLPEIRFEHNCASNCVGLREQWDIAIRENKTNQDGVVNNFQLSYHLLSPADGVLWCAQYCMA